jgi:formyltetrahydrofolate synthetase
VNVIVAVNSFANDSPAEVELVREAALKMGAMDAVVSTHWADGGKGAKALAEAVVKAADQPSNFEFLYPLDNPSRKRSKPSPARSTAPTVWITPPKPKNRSNATPASASITCRCVWQRPIFPSPPMPQKGRAHGFRITVREIRASVGAGFLYPILGEMRTMPGLPTRPVFYDVDLDLKTGKVLGLF